MMLLHIWTFSQQKMDLQTLGKAETIISSLLASLPHSYFPILPVQQKNCVFLKWFGCSGSHVVTSGNHLWKHNFLHFRKKKINLLQSLIFLALYLKGWEALTLPVKFSNASYLNIAAHQKVNTDKRTQTSSQTISRFFTLFFWTTVLLVVYLNIQ